MIDESAGSRADVLIRAYVADLFRDAHRNTYPRVACIEAPEIPLACGEHLPHCPELTVTHATAVDGVYGCDTGCEYVRFEADVSCPHGERVEGWRWGEFGDLAMILEDIAADYAS